MSESERVGDVRMIRLSDGQVRFEYICAACNKPTARLVSFGVLPIYCERCAAIVRHEKTAARTRRWRERRAARGES